MTAAEGAYWLAGLLVLGAAGVGLWYHLLRRGKR